MAYQKLQPTQAADVILSDTINPINPSRPNKTSGKADGNYTNALNNVKIATESYTGSPGVVSPNKLNVTGATPPVSFTDVKVGDTIVNVTSGLYVHVTAVDSDKILSVSADVFDDLADTYKVYTGGFFDLGINIGDIVVNTTTPAYATVTAVYSASLTLSADIFGAADGYTIYQNTAQMNSNTEPFVVYVGGGLTANQDIKVTTAAGNDIVFSYFPKGGFLPVQCVRVWSTGTAATNVVALW